MSRHSKVLSLALLAFGLVAIPRTSPAVGTIWGAITTGSNDRYQVLANFNGQAVLDWETGLIWEQCPDLSDDRFWAGALTRCYTLIKGGRSGWRAPTLEELRSLGDPNNNPFLPASNPFCSMSFDPQFSRFWTSTTSETNSASAHQVVPSNAASHGTSDKSNSYPIWCVRGGALHR